MKQANLTLTALLVVALAACQQPANDTEIAIDNQVEAADVETLPPSEEGGAPVVENSGTGSEVGPVTPGAAVIPAQYRGRWGMVPADCTSTRGDAKGLIDVSGTGIKFYEARATLKEQRPAIATSFSGLYGFTGEGQTWEKVVTLTRTGETLKRADDEGSYNYKRCT